MSMDDQSSKEQPAYRKIETILLESIESGRLTPGIVLLEGHLAAIFGSSRMPVKQALVHLRDRGLISRFEGRGFVVGPGTAEAQRIPVTAAQLGLETGNPELQKTWAWQRIYDGIERELIFRSALGRFRVNELELARYYNVGRTVAHDVLIQAQSTGLVAKDDRARWYIVPLDEKRICDLYDLRELLEPAALIGALKRITPSALRDMQTRLAEAAALYPDISAAAMDALERDLHVTCLEFGGNREILEALKRTRCLLITAKHMLGDQVSYPPDEPFMAEHLAIVAAMMRGDERTAAEQMRAHLQMARTKVIDRVVAFRKIFAGPELPYIS
jgi:DNA-binding GntR family transcriptional regulator